MVKEANEREAFIRENLGLVHAICNRFRGRGVEYEDLFQSGCMGLVKATDAFDSERGLCFSTYAVPVIMGEVRRLFRDGGSVKVARTLKEFARKVSFAQEDARKKLGREPTVGELAEHLSATPEEIAEALGVLQPTLSLTYEGEDGVSEYDLPTKSVEDLLEDKLYLEEALSKLSDTDQKILRCRYYHYLTQSKTAELLGMTQVQVSRAEKRILERLKTLLSSA